MSPHRGCSQTLLAHHVMMEGESGVTLTSAKSTTNKYLSCVAAALSVLALALTLALGLAVVLVLRAQEEGGPPRHQVFASQTATEERTPAFACVQCSKLLRDPAQVISGDPLLRKLDIEVNDGREDCCAYSSEQITALFESVLRLNDAPQPMLPSYNVSDFRFSPASAHKMLHRVTMSKDPDFGVPDFPQRPQVCLLKADDTRSGLEHHRGVNITEQGLRIVHGGLYYIYSSIQFRPQSTHPCREFRYQTFSAYVEKLSYRRSGAQNILKVSHTCCDRCTYSLESRFTGGVFILDPGDIIRVKVVGYDLVEFTPETSFLGLAMLGNAAPDSSSSSSPA